MADLRKQQLAESDEFKQASEDAAKQQAAMAELTKKVARLEKMFSGQLHLRLFVRGRRFGG